MFESLRKNNKLQLLFGFLIGICFGFLLQRGGVTRYDIIMGQLLLQDWTVVKVILTAILTGMIGIYLMQHLGWVSFHRKSGAVGSTVIGGLIFGVGFGLLGYCPGTVAGAAGQGSLDALLGGIPGLLLGAAFYAGVYDRLKKSGFLKKGNIGDVTFPQLLKMPTWSVIAIFAFLIIAFLTVLEIAGQ